MEKHTSKGGKFIGNSHVNGGIKFVVIETGQPIEVENKEFLTPNEALASDEIIEVEGTNKEIVDKINKTVGAKTTNQKATEIHAGDFITCVRSAADKTKRKIRGTKKQIISAVNASGGCNHVYSGARVEENGQVLRYSEGGDVMIAEMKDNVEVTEYIDEFTGKTVKKIYVSIKAPYDYETKKFDEAVFNEIASSQMMGVKGVSSSKFNVTNWFVLRDAMLVMDIKDFVKSNNAVQFKYSEPEFIVKNNFAVAFRLQDKSSYENESDYIQILGDVLDRVKQYIDKLYINLKAFPSKSSEIATMNRYFDKYISGDLFRQIAKDKVQYNTVREFTEEIIRAYRHVWGSDIQITSDDIYESVYLGIKDYASIYADESEWELVDETLHIPSGTKFFFRFDKSSTWKKDEVLKIWTKMNLFSRFPVYFVSYENLMDLVDKHGEEKRGIWDRKVLDEQQVLRYEIQEKLKKYFSNYVSSLVDKIENKVNEHLTEQYDGTTLSDIDKWGIIKDDIEKKIYSFTKSKFIDEDIQRVNGFVIDEFLRFMRTNIRDGIQVYDEDIYLVNRKGYQFTVYGNDITSQTYDAISSFIGDESVSRSITELVGMDWHRLFPKESMFFNDGGQTILENILDAYSDDGSVAKEQLKRGIEVEKEHQNLYRAIKKDYDKMGNPMPMSETEFYKTIAEVHTVENPIYYSLLDRYIEDEHDKDKLEYRKVEKAEKLTHDPFIIRTGMPLFDNMIDNPTYFQTEKNTTFTIQEMTPQDYLNLQVIEKGIPLLKDLSYGINDENLEYLKRKMLAGEEFYMPMIEYENGEYFSQEGRHRCIAAHELGLAIVPVMIVHRTKSMEDGGGIGSGEHAAFTNQMFWGSVGGGVLPICKKTGRILIALRSEFVNEPNTYGVWGGKIDEEDGETEKTVFLAVRREFEEETGYDFPYEMVEAFVYEAPKVPFKYYNFIGLLDNEFSPRLNWENQAYDWVTLEELYDLEPLWHFGLKALMNNQISLNMIKEFTNISHNQDTFNSIYSEMKLNDEIEYVKKISQ